MDLAQIYTNPSSPLSALFLSQSYFVLSTWTKVYSPPPQWGKKEVGVRDMTLFIHQLTSMLSNCRAGSQPTHSKHVFPLISPSNDFMPLSYC